MKDLTGQKFGRLTVLKFDKVKNTNYYWICKCKCGTVKIVNRRNLTSGHTKSCGCIFKEHNWNTNLKHGMAHTPFYTKWKSMKQRCNNKKHKE